MSQLSKDDLKILRDKNLIKLFKLGQLSTEYLLYQQQYMDGMCEQVDIRYQKQFDRTKKLEDEVKENQRIINAHRAEIKRKKHTLKTYEGILKQPGVINEETMEIAQKCEFCCKLFATPEHLNSHYQRKHPDEFKSVIRPKQDDKLRSELGEIVQEYSMKNNQLNQDQIIGQIKTEVVDRFNENLVHL